MYELGREMAEGRAPQTLVNRIIESMLEQAESTKNMDPTANPEAELKKLVRVSKKASSKSYGKLPGELKELVDDLLSPSKLPWNRILRNLVSHSRAVTRQRTVSRAKRRMIGMWSKNPRTMIFPGSKKNYEYNIVFIIDTSGSMNTESLLLAASELQGIQRTSADTNITVVEADVKITAEYKLARNKKINTEFSGRGGTDFNAALARAKELEADFTVYATDGYASKPSAENLPDPSKLLWLLTPGHTASVVEGTGKILEVDDVP